MARGGIRLSGFPSVLAALSGLKEGLDRAERREAWVGSAARHAGPVEYGWQRGNTVVPPQGYFELGLTRVSKSLTDSDANDVMAEITNRQGRPTLLLARRAQSEIRLVIIEKRLIRRNNLFFSIETGETVEEMLANSRSSMPFPEEALG